MKRAVWKWIFGISIVMMALLILFMVGAWILLNIGGAIFLTLMGNSETNAISFSALLANFPGSPLSYIFVADFSALLLSAVALIATRKR